MIVQSISLIGKVHLCAIARGIDKEGLDENAFSKLMAN